jgi:hypothetical protein
MAARYDGANGSGGGRFLGMENVPQSGIDPIVVRIWGMDADGKAFFQNANARNLTARTALLTGVDHELKVGDSIGVQLGDQKARVRVLQAVNAGLPLKIKVDVELMDGQECPWKQHIGQAAPAAKSATKEDPRSRRRFVRHRIAFPIDLRDDRGGGVPMQTSASDVGGRGCYVETLTPLPLGTPLHVTFWMDTEKVTTAAMVRASDPGVGMGIEFIGLSLEEQQRVQNYLDKIDPPKKGFV